jgi:DNA polymerase III delta prime subunit
MKDITISKSNDIHEKQLFFEKFRPSTLEDLVLPTRISNLLEKGIVGNYLFHGAAGCGKTSAVRILLQEYEEYSLIINGKIGVDELRETIERFSKQMVVFGDVTKFKVVYFEEFDKATPLVQEELKTFIEDNSSRVRFLATCNKVNKLDSALLSRFMLVDFTLSNEEAKSLKNEFAKKAYTIIQNNDINVDKEALKNIVGNSFPDFRKTWNNIQLYHLSGGLDNGVSHFDTDLFKLITDNKNPVETWEYIYVNWSDRLDTLFNKIGTEYYGYIKQYHANKINILAPSIITITDYTNKHYVNCIDPFVTSVSLIYELQKIYNNK